MGIHAGSRRWGAGKIRGFWSPSSPGSHDPPTTRCGTSSPGVVGSTSGRRRDKAFLPGGGGRGSDTRTGSRRSSAGRWHGLPETPFSWTQTQTAPHPAEEAGTEPGAKPRLRADLRRALHVPRGLSFSFCREQVDAAQRSVAWQ